MTNDNMPKGEESVPTGALNKPSNPQNNTKQVKETNTRKSEGLEEFVVEIGVRNDKNDNKLKIVQPNNSLTKFEGPVAADIESERKESYLMIRRFGG